MEVAILHPTPHTQVGWWGLTQELNTELTALHTREAEGSARGGAAAGPWPREGALPDGPQPGRVPPGSAVESDCSRNVPPEMHARILPVPGIFA